MSSLYVIAGPNGAGKTTFIKRFAPREIAVLDFLNADEVARGLSPLAPERAQFEAGRIVLSRFEQFVGEGRNFCLETTLSGRTYRKHFAAARAAGYCCRRSRIRFAVSRIVWSRADTMFRSMICAVASASACKTFSPSTAL
jgi:predicted ABC-type ATPase